ncbi:hypothetical protein [Acuticoccus kandeliae]|uniref:hypothetical protein n=1 Tax=Acuticoccus kandeliae TaxID=2073160 RepID=UPI000D3E7B6E|nr:hypothetical protein [Acuticoccus kandeliae]
MYTYEFRARWALRAAAVALVAVATIAAGLTTPVAAAEARLRLISAYPKTHNLNKPLLALIEDVNAQGKGVVQIDFLGGPEAMPSGEMLQALSGGVVDLFYGASSLFSGDVPEAVAQNGSNLSAAELREKGALDLLSTYFEERVNTKYLGYFGSGYNFYIYLLKEPEMKDDGSVDLEGWKIRGGSPYKTFLDRLGVIMISIFPPDMYAAMERGVIDGLVWTSVSVTDDGWPKFIKYRIAPSWRQGDIALMANLSKWDGLSDEAKALLTKVIAENEIIAHDNYKKQAVAEEEKLHEAGIVDIDLEGAAREAYLDAAIGNLWEDMAANVDPAEVEKLKAAFYDPSKN